MPLPNRLEPRQRVPCGLSDLSWEGENRVIRRCAAAFADLDADVQVRNQARVHLWYPEKFGVPH